MTSHESTPTTAVDTCEASDVSRDDPVEGLPETLKERDFIVVRDPVYSGGGGIEVVADVARFLDAPIYTMRQTAEVKPYRNLDVREFKPEESPLARYLREFGLRRLLTLPEITEYENWEPPRDVDVVVTIGARSQHVIHHAHQDRVHFFFTPPRWLWDLSYGQWDDRPEPVRRAMLLYANHVRALDVTSTERFDRVLAGSEVVKERVESYYDIEANVAYCPVDTFEFEHRPSEGYFLMLTRIAPEKRVNLVIEAFNRLGLPLKIAGTASDSSAEYAEDCRELAGETIEFLGWVEGERKRDLLSDCEALVFAAEREDFGMPPIEAMAAGKPVVGVNEGYTQYQIDSGVTGVLFEPTVDDLVSALEKYQDISWEPKTIQERSRQYDTRAVRRQWIRTIRQLRM